MAACDHSTTAPKPSAVGFDDPAGIVAVVSAVESTFATPALRSFSALRPLFVIPGAPASAVRSEPAACAAQQSLAPMRSGPIPDSVVRRVFYYEPTASSYLASADSSGPLGGVRFLLYQTDSIGGLRMPLLTDGWFDLVDQGAGGFTGSIRGSAGAGADYTITPSGTQTNYRMLMAGSVTNGTRSLTFRDSTTTAYVQVGSVVTLQAGGAQIDLNATRAALDAYDGFYDVDFKLANATDTARIYGSITTYCLISTTSLRIAVRGTDYAEVVTGSNGPVIVRLDKQPLDDAQAQAMWSLIRVQSELFDWMQAFFMPARQLLPP